MRANQTTVCVSALSGDGLDELGNVVAARLSQGFEELDIDLRPDDGATLAWLYRNGDVLARDDSGETIHLRVRLAPAKAGQFNQRHGG